MENERSIKSEWIQDFENLFISLAEREIIRNEIENYVFICQMESYDELPHLDFRDFSKREVRIVDGFNHIVEVNNAGIHIRSIRVEKPFTGDAFVVFCKCLAEAIGLCPDIFENGYISLNIEWPKSLKSDISKDLAEKISQVIKSCVSQDAHLVKTSIIYTDNIDDMTVLISEIQCYHGAK